MDAFLSVIYLKCISVNIILQIRYIRLRGIT